ncbi:MAG: GNAT family N-acetyltransferase [Rhodospirillales bacterium]|nr:GNAT family N-acetyltransferase [Rhodospirillales bacterium]MBO6788103.1 GNAT family N-acetyltransferase [Rhodospirillales bacterium]
MTEIVTENLIMKPYVADDAARMAALHADPAVMDFMKDSRPLPPEEAAETFQQYLRGWQQDGFGLFAVRNYPDDAFVGECGFWHRSDKPGVSMRFLMYPAFWGRGLGTEMNDAVTAWLFAETDVPSFWAVTQARNKGAVAILRRLGGRVTETAHMGRPGLLRFDIDRPAWEEARAKLQD